MVVSDSAVGGRLISVVTGKAKKSDGIFLNYKDVV
jgi:hypothetical protein